MLGNQPSISLLKDQLSRMAAELTADITALNNNKNKTDEETNKLQALSLERARINNLINEWRNQTPPPLTEEVHTPNGSRPSALNSFWAALATGAPESKQNSKETSRPG
jgi:hypothetical protein